MSAIADMLDTKSSTIKNTLSSAYKKLHQEHEAMDRRAKLLGLDAPEQKKVETSFAIQWMGEEDESVIIDANLIEEKLNGKGSSKEESG